MPTTRITLNHRTIQDYLDGGHGMEQLLEDRAMDVLDWAYSTAPVVSGEYQDSLHIETDHTDRMVKRVISDAPHALVVEANEGTLSRALDVAK